LDVIRRALTDTAGDVKASEHWAATTGTLQEDGRLAQVAVAGYRLLDPRRRRSLFERVQLLLWTEEDLDGTSGSLLVVRESASSIAAPPPVASAPAISDGSSMAATSEPTRVVAKPAANPAAPPIAPPLAPSVGVAPAPQLAEETQVALDVFRSLRRRDRRATALWVGIAALALSLPAAVALVLGFL
jgi:hypothetical protein